MYQLSLSELCALHHFIMEGSNRLKDEDGNLPFDHVSKRRASCAFDAGYVVLTEIMENRYTDYIA